jgi:hypothetical protein
LTVLDQVRDLIVQRTPQPICDDCITRALNVSGRQHTNQKTRELERLPGFDRRVGVCPECGTMKMLTSHI